MKIVKGYTSYIISFYTINSVREIIDKYCGSSVIAGWTNLRESLKLKGLVQGTREESKVLRKQLFVSQFNCPHKESMGTVTLCAWTESSIYVI